MQNFTANADTLTTKVYEYPGTTQTKMTVEVTRSTAKSTRTLTVVAIVNHNRESDPTFVVRNEKGNPLRSNAEGFVAAGREVMGL